MKGCSPMCSFRIHSCKGFTLVELMVAVAISLIVLLAAGFMFSATLQSSHANLRSVTLEQDIIGAIP